MSESVSIECDLPSDADGAITIVRRLAGAGHQALLAGGCVRDLLLEARPSDYDVATDATPKQICQLFRRTRKVGAQFGVVLAREKRRWVEVATFRSDGEYLDGRRPSEVHFCDARHDAERRDFTINGMFLDLLAGTLIDYVGGRADLDAKLIRAIGDPPARFNEDYLRLLRAVRFAARLEFALEPDTLAALKSSASNLSLVAAERVREEVEKMLSHRSRRRAFRLMAETNLLECLWAGASWSAGQIAAAGDLLGDIPDDAPHTLAFAAMLADRPLGEIDRVCRALKCSNEQREMIVWLAGHHADLDEPASVELASLKRLMARDAFASLRMWSAVRFARTPGGANRDRELSGRIAGVPPEAVEPAPLVTGEDLHDRRVPPGPIYKRVLDELYTRQLNETLTTRDKALAALDELLLDVEQ